MLLLQNHFVIAPGKILLSLISVQQNRLGGTSQGTSICLLLRALRECQLACHSPIGKDAGIPVRKEPGLGAGHELHPNTGGNLPLAANQTCMVVDGRRSSNSGEQTAEFPEVHAECWTCSSLNMQLGK